MTAIHERDTDSIRHDPRRLQAVRDLGLLDTPAEETFDRLTRLAAKLVSAPATFISLVDERRDFYKSCYGFPEPLVSTRELEGATFCHYAITSHQPLVLNDVTTIPVLCDILSVHTLGVRAYVGVPLVDDMGEVVGSFCAVDTKPRDWTVTEVEVLSELAESALREVRMRAAVRLAERQTHKAQRAVRDREELLAVVAHDLRTPLGVIANGTHVLAHQQLGDAAAAVLNSVRGATGQMAGLINDLLDIATFEAGKLTLQRQAVGVATLLNDAAAMLNPIAERNKVAVRVLAGPVLPAVWVDYERVLRVFSNLVSNAIKHSHVGGVVLLTARDSDADVRFAVTDEGSGMTPEQLARAFDRFWQADHHDQRGRGLGLSIVKAIVEAHGGSVIARSEPGLGSTFEFTLPRVTTNDDAGSGPH
jgi:signal transduction histidine kinase